MQKAPPPPHRTAVRERTLGLRAQREQVVVKSAHVVLTEVRSRESPGPLWPRAFSGLLQFDDGALRFELLFDFFGFLLRHAFLYGAGRTFDQILRLFESETGDRTDLLDHLNLLLAARLQDDRERR